MSYFAKNFDEKIVKLLKSGAVGFMPTDTIYGLSAIALDEAAVKRIYEIKQRDGNKPSIILLASVEQAGVLGLELDNFKHIQELWPAQLTFICPVGNTSPLFLHRGWGTLAVRVPDDSRIRKLIAETGPIISTSANLQGQPVIETVGEAKKFFGDKLDFFVDGGTLNGEASTIVQVQDNELMVLRQGAYELNRVEVGKKAFKTL